MSEQPPEVTDAFLEKLLSTIATCSVGAMLMALAAGESRAVVKQNRHGEGWVIEVEPIRDEQFYSEVPLRPSGQNDDRRP